VAFVLIVDDDPDYATVLAELISAQGHDVRVGHSGAEGLSIALKKQPDLALVDVQMPSLSGPELAQQLRQRNSGLESVPLVLLSGAPNLRELARQVGTPYFLAKPFRVGQIVKLIERALAERIAPLPPHERA
jgi:CheY-like chemotaxis protein